MNSSRFIRIYSIILISLTFRKNDVKMISYYDKKEFFQNCTSGNLKNEFLATHKVDQTILVFTAGWFLPGIETTLEILRDVAFTF